MKPTSCYCNSTELDDLLEQEGENARLISDFVLDTDIEWEEKISEYKSYGIKTTYYSPDKLDMEVICLSCLLDYKEVCNETH